MADTKKMEIHKFEFIVLFSKIEKAWEINFQIQ